MSKEKDRDIIEYINPLLNKYSFSAAIRELVRDGIRYRDKPVTSSLNQYVPQEVLQSNPSPLSSSLQNVKLEEKEMSFSDIESRLDSF